MESLVEELTCPVCLDLYEQPVLLPCAHSLCKRCAGEVFASRKPSAQPAGQGMAPKAPHECPSCRHEFQLPKIGVDGLRKNTTLQNIVDRYRESKNNTAAPKAVPCEMCEEPSNDALKTCLVCDTSYCEACLSKYHPMKAGLARHTLVEASAATPKVLMCTEHPQEKVNMYCETDECLVCSLCKLVGKHQDHKVAAVSDTFQQKKESIGGRVAGLIQKNAEVECFVDKIQQTMTKAEQNCADIKGQVEAFAQNLVATIMKRKDVLQTKVDVEKDQKLKTLGQKLGQWADTGTGISAAITEAEALLNEEDPITFLQTSKTVVDRIAAFESLEERKLNTTDNFVHNTLLVSDLEQKVSSLDFLQGMGMYHKGQRRGSTLAPRSEVSQTQSQEQNRERTPQGRRPNRPNSDWRQNNRPNPDWRPRDGPNPDWFPRDEPNPEWFPRDRPNPELNPGWFPRDGPNPGWLPHRDRPNPEWLPRDGPNPGWRPRDRRDPDDRPNWLPHNRDWHREPKTFNRPFHGYDDWFPTALDGPSSWSLPKRFEDHPARRQNYNY